MADDAPKPAAMPAGPVGMSQRSRSGLDVLGAMLKYSSVDLRGAARAEFETSPEGKALSAEHADKSKSDKALVAARVERAKQLTAQSANYRLERFVQRFVAEEMMSRNLVSVEEKRDEHLRIDNLPLQGAGGTLELHEDMQMPEYYDGVHYHLAPIGIDDYELGGKGAGIGRVFRYGGFAAVPPGSNIGQQRIDVVKQFRNPNMKRILEIGCGGIFTLMSIGKVFPNAELIGCDLNGRGLKESFRMAERMGFKVNLKQRDARDTGEADESVDGVFSYAVHHEAPVPVNMEMFREVFRVLKPGGEFVMSDPPPFRSVDLFDAVLLEWDNDNREEPYFNETCLADWDEALREIGFVDVSSYGLGPASYPWVTRAVKPA